MAGGRAVTGVLDPYATDDTTRVSIVVAGTEYPNISTYSYTSDVLQLGDPCAVAIPDPNLKVQTSINPGDKIEFFTTDPDVSGGQKTRRVLGLVTATTGTTNRQQGTVIQVGGADLGWHLVNTDAPIWFRLQGATFQTLFNRVLDASWGFVGVAGDNLANRKLNLGGAFARSQQNKAMLKFIPPVQTEVGTKIADLLIEYSRREKALVNVSADGYLQFWQPDYNQQASFSFECHPVGEAGNEDNNILEASLSRTIDGVYSQVQCIWSVLRPPKQQDQNNSHPGRQARTYKPSPNPLPFTRRLTVSDPDQLSGDQAQRRAQWKWQRGMFDSWEYTIVVKGHTQSGLFYAPDTIAQVNDSVLNVRGNFYVSAVKYERSRQKGTRTTLTLKKKDLLSA